MSGCIQAAAALRMALAGDALADPARSIAVNGLLGESAALRGDEAEVFARLRAIAAALEEAREIVRLAGRMAP